MMAQRQPICIDKEVCAKGSTDTHCLLRKWGARKEFRPLFSEQKNIWEFHVGESARVRMSFTGLRRDFHMDFWLDLQPAAVLFLLLLVPLGAYK